MSSILLRAIVDFSNTQNLGFSQEEEEEEEVDSIYGPLGNGLPKKDHTFFSTCFIYSSAKISSIVAY
jgi:hypothetical protein